jgi:hypothetical protein
MTWKNLIHISIDWNWNTFSMGEWELILRCQGVSITKIVGDHSPRPYAKILWIYFILVYSFYSLYCDYIFYIIVDVVSIYLQKKNTYFEIIWGTTKPSNIKRIQPLQSKIFRKIASAPFYLCNRLLHKDLNVPFVSDLATSRLLVLSYLIPKPRQSISWCKRLTLPIYRKALLAGDKLTAVPSECSSAVQC